MKLAALLLLTAMEVTSCSGQTTTTTTRGLRGGGKVVHTRTTYEHSHHSHHDDRHLRVEPLVASRVHPHTDHHDDVENPDHHQYVEGHHYVPVQGIDENGKSRTILIDTDALEGKMAHEEKTQRSQTRGGGGYSTAQKKSESTSKNAAGGADTRNRNGPSRSNSEHKQQVHHTTRDTLDHNSVGSKKAHRPNRSDRDLHHDNHEHHFEGHIAVERHHEHHYKHHGREHKKRAPTPYKMNFGWDSTMHHSRLPTGSSFHFNQTLFDSLHDAPFKVYESALGHSLDEGESFPIFALPQRSDAPGIYTGFSKYASALVFENMHSLLKWDALQEANDAVIPEELQEHISNTNFHANLIVGKSMSEGGNHVEFIGALISYYQFGREKNVLVPFSKLEDFFDDASEKFLLDPSTKNLEMDALHQMMEKKRRTNSKFDHPAWEHTERRKQALADLDTDQFKKLFQLLTRRTYLFVYGYADCLQNEPGELRKCLDDTFYHLIKMETAVRGALDEEILHALVDINHTFHTKVSEACITTQGSGTGVLYGTGSCYSHGDLGAFVMGGHNSVMSRLLS